MLKEQNHDKQKTINLYGKGGNSMMTENETYTISLCKIKEGRMDFVAAIFDFSQDWLDEKYGEGNAKGFVRNAEDGTYEIFAEIKEE